MRIKSKTEPTPYQNRHLVFEVWFNMEPLTEADGWTRTEIRGCRPIGIRSVCQSDGSSVRYFRYAPTKSKPVAKAQKLAKKKEQQREERSSFSKR
jgi:hypothetical protein